MRVKFYLHRVHTNAELNEKWNSNKIWCIYFNSRKLPQFLVLINMGLLYHPNILYLSDKSRWSQLKICDYTGSTYQQKAFSLLNYGLHK